MADHFSQRTRLVMLSYRAINNMPSLPLKLTDQEILLALSVAAALEAAKAEGPVKIPLPKKPELPKFLRWHALPDD